MKRGTTPNLPVTIGFDITLISEVTFIFKSRLSETAETILSKRFPDEVSNVDGVFYIPFTEAETRLFTGEFYMDTQIITVLGKIPETDIVKLYMNPTLFKYQQGGEE